MAETKPLIDPDLFIEAESTLKEVESQWLSYFRDARASLASARFYSNSGKMLDAVQAITKACDVEFDATFDCKACGRISTALRELHCGEGKDLCMQPGCAICAAFESDPK